MTPPLPRDRPDQETVPPVAASVFGDRLALAQRFAELLVTDGVEHGLIGPRESARIWTRHLLNCAVVAEQVPSDARVVDVGSGAGLPGLVLAIRRPDVRIDLVEPLLRRTVFLESAVTQLGLAGQVRVVRGRAEEPAVRRSVGGAGVVTARAVAPLDRLVRWCLPLLAPGGTMLALKGATAAGELAEHAALLSRLGARQIDLVECGDGIVTPPTIVIRLQRGPAQKHAQRGHG